MVALVNIVWILSGIPIYFWAFTTVFSFFSKGFVFVGCANASTRLIFQITTRNCPRLIQRTIDSVLESCKQVGYTNFQIWIVTDNPDPPRINGVDSIIVVPANFTCLAKYKARALEYSRLARINKGYHGWIYFLDEENWLSMQTVKAITSFAQNQSRLMASGPLAFFGHGSKLAWLGDSIRTSTCRTCHFGHSLGHWPLHGENMLVHSDVEKKVNWLGSSLTEDFLFSSRAAAAGYKTGWHGGVLYSYSPSSLTDLILQRRRWFRGFIGIVFTSNILWLYRILALYLIISGLLGIVFFITTLVAISIGFIPIIFWVYVIPFMILLCAAYYLGTQGDLKDKVMSSMLAWMLVVLDSIAAWLSIIIPPKRFDIINKEMNFPPKTGQGG